MSSSRAWRTRASRSTPVTCRSRRSRAAPASARSRRCGAPSGAASESAPPTTAAAFARRRPDQRGGPPVKIAIPLYARFTALDAVGPYEVLQRLPGAEIAWLAHEPGPVGTDTGKLQLYADAAFEDVPDPEIVVV